MIVDFDIDTDIDIDIVIGIDLSASFWLQFHNNQLSPCFFFSGPSKKIPS
jgi:hypothetical protein